MKITLLDGPIGTQLIERGHACPAPAWSAQPMLDNPKAVESIHQEYAAAGAMIHTTNTFRTRPDAIGEHWIDLAQKAVQMASRANQKKGRVAGAIAPLEDCYRPDLSPPNPGPAHAELADILAQSGVDILLCETFPHIPEALAAVNAAVDTGVDTWVSFTAGPDGNLLTADEMRTGAEQAVAAGAKAVLVNCTPASQTHRFIAALTGLGVPFGAYANAGHPDEGLGWIPDPDGPARYADMASRWIEMGATIIGSCCGTGPQHTKALYDRFCVGKD